MLDQPRQALRRARQIDDLQTEAGPGERAAVGAQPLPVGQRELLEHVGDDTVVGGGGRPEHRDPGVEQVEHVLDAAVVRPEVVSPVGNAMRLVDHYQPHRRREQRQHVVAEAGVVESLRTDQQQVDRVGGEPCANAVPLLAIGAVDRVGAQPQPLRGGDLVAHQCQQGTDDQRGTRAGAPQQRRRHEVHRRLPPTSALDAQNPGAIGDQVPDRLELSRPELRLSIRRQRAQAIQRTGSKRLGGRGRHGSILARGPEDIRADAGRPPPTGLRRQQPPKNERYRFSATRRSSVEMLPWRPWSFRSFRLLGEPLRELRALPARGLQRANLKPLVPLASPGELAFSRALIAALADDAGVLWSKALPQPAGALLAGNERCDQEQQHHDDSHQNPMGRAARGVRGSG